MSLIDPTGILTGIAVEAVMRGADGLWKFTRRRPRADAAADEDVFPRPIPSLPPCCVLPEEALGRLRQGLENPNIKVIVVDGPVGSGKRTLAAGAINPPDGSPPGSLRPSRVAHIDLTLEVWPDDLKTTLNALDDGGSLVEEWDRSTSLEQRLRLIARARFSRPTLLWLTHLEALESAGDAVWKRAIPAFLADLDTSDNGLRILLTSRIVPEGLRALAPGTCERIRLPIGLPAPERGELLDALAEECAPLSRLPAPERNDFLDVTRGNPMLMGRVANALRLDDGETTWRALASGDIASDIEALWESAYRRLSARQQSAVGALAVLGLPSPVEAVAALLEAEAGEPGLRAALDHLNREGLLDPVASPDGEPLFALRPLDRAPALRSLEPARRDAAHAAAARYYAGRLAHYAGEARGATSYARFYRFEDPAWQGSLTEWLWHQARSPGDHSGRLELAHIFLGAFWWWDEYLEFPFVDGLLKRWRETQGDSADQRFAAVLESFRNAYPRGSLASRAGLPGWKTALESLDALRRDLSDVAGQADVAAAAVDALTAYYRAECFQFRAALSREARDAGYTEALRLYNEAQAGFEALSAEAVEGHPLGVEYDWAAPYVLARKAELLADMGDGRAAVAALAEGLSRLARAEAPASEGDADLDLEARTWLYRAAGDIFWRWDRRAEAWAAYRLLAWNAFLFQWIPPPADDYSVAIYEATRRHISARMDEAGNGAAEQQEAAFRAFWQPWREMAGGVWPADGKAEAGGNASSCMPPTARPGDWDFVDGALELLNSPAAADIVRREEARLADLPGMAHAL